MIADNSIEARLARITDALVLIAAGAIAITSRDLASRTIEPVDIARAIKHAVDAAIDELYWIGTSPRTVLETPAPTDDERTARDAHTP